MTEQQHQEFETLVRPVIEWLNANYHPHVTIVIDQASAVISKGIISFLTKDYLRD